MDHIRFLTTFHMPNRPNQLLAVHVTPTVDVERPGRIVQFIQRLGGQSPLNRPHDGCLELFAGHDAAAFDPQFARPLIQIPPLLPTCLLPAMDRPLADFLSVTGHRFKSLCPPLNVPIPLWCVAMPMPKPQGRRDHKQARVVAHRPRGMPLSDS